MPNVVLGTYNTIAITAASGVYRLNWVSGSSRALDLMNLGPGTIFIRADLDPTVDDPRSLEIPANWAINHLDVDGRTGLGLIATADTRVSMRAA